MGVAEQLESILADAPDPPRGAQLRGLRDRLEVAATRAVELLEGHDAVDALPLRLPKRRVLDLLACERLAVARHASPEDATALPVPVLRGLALDRFVQQVIHGCPVLDPVGDLSSAFEAEGDESRRAEVVAAAPQLGVAELAASAGDWAGLAPSWWPRTQSPVAVHLAGGRVRCEGRVDVELGGPLSGRPGVVVEVKVGRPHPSHLGEATHYALLVALRDDEGPAVVARWYPGAALAHQVVTAEVLEGAARRLAEAIGTWAELEAGRTPRERSGPGCGWCPDADRCPSYRPAPDPFEDLDSDGAPGPFDGEDPR